MRKIYLTVIGLYLLFLNAFSQTASDTSGNYKNRKLKLEETNLISAHLNKATFENCDFTGATYDDKTRFPPNFDPFAEGMIKVDVET